MLGWLLYGLGSLFAVLRFPIEGGESTMNYIQIVVFLVLSVIHYVMRKPKA